MQKLIDAVRKILEEWIQGTKISNNAWISGKEGKIYVRYNRYFDRIDLASFEIKPKFQKKGVSKSIVLAAISMPVKTIRIENIVNKNWGKYLENYNLPGFETKTQSFGNEDICYSIDFIRK